MLKATKLLPAQYRQYFTISLQHNFRWLLLLNLLGLALFFGLGYLYLRISFLLRPQDALQGLDIGLLASLVISTLIYFATIVLHEVIHGVALWLYIHEKPSFGFKGAYAFTGAAAWYLPRNAHLVIALAPLLLISLLTWAAFPFVPAAWLIYLGLAFVANASGAIGDLAVVIWELTQPEDIYLQDLGDALVAYHPTNS